MFFECPKTQIDPSRASDQRDVDLSSLILEQMMCCEQESAHSSCFSREAFSKMPRMYSWQEHARVMTRGLRSVRVGGFNDGHWFKFTSHEHNYED